MLGADAAHKLLTPKLALFWSQYYNQVNQVPPGLIMVWLRRNLFFYPFRPSDQTTHHQADSRASTPKRSVTAATLVGHYLGMPCVLANNSLGTFGWEGRPHYRIAGTQPFSGGTTGYGPGGGGKRWQSISSDNFQEGYYPTSTCMR